MKRALVVPKSGDPTALIELAAEVEAAGWDGFFVWDHVQVYVGDLAGRPGSEVVNGWHPDHGPDEYEAAGGTWLLGGPWPEPDLLPDAGEVLRRG